MAHAQRPNLPVVGFVNSTSPGAYPPVSVFLKGLEEAGFVDGRNVTIEYHWAEGHYEKLPAIIAGLIQRKVDVIAATSTPAATAAKAAKTTITVVFTTSGDPIQLGFVSSLNEPGSNFTGVTAMNVEVTSKRLELMHEVFPNARTMALLVNPPNPQTSPISKESAAAADALGLKLEILRAGNEQELSAIFERLDGEKSKPLVIASDAYFANRAELLGALPLRHHVPAIFQYPQFTDGGGLMSYDGGVYVGRILGGANREKPVQQITKVELVVNLKAAKTLGVTFPLPLLGRADKVIE